MTYPLPKVLVDTSSWIECLRSDGDRAVADRVTILFTEGQACTNEIILLELWNGARAERERRVLKDLQREIEQLPITSAVWEKAYEIARLSRANGKTIPPSDLIIFSTAKYYNVPLDHCDKHFSTLEEIGAK